MVVLEKLNAASILMGVELTFLNEPTLIAKVLSNLKLARFAGVC